MRLLTLIVVIALIAGIVVHTTNGTMIASSNGKHYAVRDHEAAQKALAARRNARVHQNANTNGRDIAVARAQRANIERDQRLAEKKRALADKENSEHDLAKDILASENAGLYQKKRLSILKKDVLDEKRAWRQAKLVGREREKDRAARDYSDSKDEKEAHDKESKSAAAKHSDTGAQQSAERNADSKSAAKGDAVSVHGSGDNIGSDANYHSSYQH